MKIIESLAKKKHQLLILGFVIINAAIVIRRFIIGLGKDVFTDDAYYYILTAVNYHSYGFFTFDSINETNGFHPLFMWVITLLLTFFPYDNPYRTYHLILLFSALFLLMFIISLGIVFSILHKYYGVMTSFYVVGLPLTIIFLGRISIYFAGMESTLTIVLMTFIILGTLYKKRIATTIFCLLLVAARLDSIVFFVIPLSIYNGWQTYNSTRSLKKSIEIFLIILIPSALFVTGYMLYNHWAFGYYKPIHGSLKSSLPLVNLHLNNLQSVEIKTTLVMAVVGFGLLFRRYYTTQDMRRLGFFLGFVSILYILNFLLFQKWNKELPFWYYSICLLLSSITLFIGVKNVISQKKLMKLSSVFIILFAFKTSYGLFLVCTYFTSTPASKFVDKDIFRFIKTLDYANFAKTDTGKLAYWSEKNIVNLDGLINNYEYQLYLKNRQLREYLKSKNVRYLIADNWNVEPSKSNQEPMYRYRVHKHVYKNNYSYFPFYVYSYMEKSFSDTLILYKEAEIFRTQPFKDAGINARMIIYDLSINDSISREKVDDQEGILSR